MDFTSALYLGIKHDTSSLAPWQRLTTGAPAALREDPASGQIAKAIARLQGLEQGLLYPSTLHLFWDLFEYWSSRHIAIYLDQEAYPIAGWGLGRAAQKGVPVHLFRRNDTSGLFRHMRQNRTNGRQPVIVTDGWCPQRGKAAPLLEYLEILQPYDGWLILDDTQGLGIIGRQPSSGKPYGYGGGGVLPWLGIGNSNVLAGSSLAKAFGVPVAVLSGPAGFIRQVQQQSLTRLHCSPPSAAILSAAQHALAVNRKDGDQRRNLLLQRIRQFKNGLQENGIGISSSLFPIQHLPRLPGSRARALHERLQRQGIQTVLTRGQHEQPQISFLIRADHRKEEIDAAVRLIATDIVRGKTRRFF